MWPFKLHKYQTTTFFISKFHALLEGAEPLPKTYLLINETWEYFKPRIQVELEPHEKDIVTEIFIRK